MARAWSGFLTDSNIAREARLQLLASRQGLAVRKSYSCAPNPDGHENYLIIDLDRNWTVAGEGFNLELDEVERCSRKDANDQALDPQTEVIYI
jgi:hypothetical protein